MGTRSQSRGRSSDRSSARSPRQKRSKSGSDQRRRSFSRHDSHSRSPDTKRDYRRDRYHYSRSRERSGERRSSRFLSQSPGIPRSSKIIVEKLTKNVHEGHLREIFGSYGPIEDIDLPMSRQFMTNRGSAYVVFESPDDAETAISHMHEAQLDGAVISVSSIHPRRRPSTSPPPARRSPPSYEEREAPFKSYSRGIVLLHEEEEVVAEGAAEAGVTGWMNTDRDLRAVHGAHGGDEVLVTRTEV